MTEITKTFEAADITDQLRQLSLSDISRLSEEKKTELLTAINSKLETLKKDKKNGNIAKAGTELRQILYDVRRLDLQKLIEKSETVQEVKSQLAALESVENSLNTSDKAREAMGKMKISDDSPEGIDMQPGEIINAQKGWDISKALNGLDLSKATSEQLPALLNIIGDIGNTRYDLVYKEGGKIDSIVKEEGGPEKYLNVYSEFKNTFARLRNEADTNALKTIDLRGIQNDPNIGDKVAAQGLDTIQYDYQLKEGVLTRTNKTSKITDYRNDEANIWETSQERDARLAQEKIKEEEPGKIADIIGGEHATGDSIDAPGHGLDPAYSYKRTENSITRTKDGKTDIWDTESKKWSTEADETARIAKENETIEGTNEYKEKMRTIFEEMRSNPDVYSENDTGKETYEFNGQQLSLEGEEPNQYLTRVVDGKTQMWSSEPEEWEEITIPSPEFALKSTSGEMVTLKKGEIKEIDGSKFYRSESGDVIAIREKMLGNKGTIPVESYQKLNDKNEWVDVPLTELPPQLHAQLFEAQYGHIEDWELGEGTSELRNITIGDLDRAVDPANTKVRTAGRAILEKLTAESKKPGKEKMGELTLHEYNDFNKNPDAFAQSEKFVGEQKVTKGQRIVTENVGFVDPSKYGIENGGYEYARYGDLVIKRPADKSEHDNPEKVLVVVDGQTMTADEYIANKAKADLDGKIPGTNISYKKDLVGNVEMENKKYIAATRTWEKTTNVS